MTNPRRRRGEASSGDGNQNHNGSLVPGSSSPNPIGNTSSRRPGRHRDRETSPTPSWRESRCWYLSKALLLVSLMTSIVLSAILYDPGDEDDLSLLEAWPEYGSDSSGSEGLVIVNPEDGEDFEFTDSRPASTLLRTVVNSSQDLLQFEGQLSSFLAGERLASLLKEELQPVQDRVTSLTTQTSGYEKMDHIPGGPTHFISTALQELDALEENQLAKLDDKVTTIIAEETKMAIGMGASVLKLFESASFIIEEAPLIPTLIQEGIYLSPEDDLEGDQVRVDELLEKYPLPSILPVVAALADKLALKEAAIEGVQQVRRDLGLAPFDFGLGDLPVDPTLSEEEEAIMNQSGELSIAVDLLEWRSGEVEELLEDEENLIRLQLVIPHHTRVMQRVQTLQDDLLNYATQKRRAYLNLRYTLTEDVRKLKIRIQNLRYKYAKIVGSS